MARCTGASPDFLSSLATSTFHMRPSWLVRVQLHYLIKEMAPVHQGNHANALVQTMRGGCGSLKAAGDRDQVPPHRVLAIEYHLAPSAQRGAAAPHRGSSCSNKPVYGLSAWAYSA